MGESLEMYLVMTALLRQDPQQPVPISLLAGRLAVTAVSANEMCRKLNERGLVCYQPYKGVTLTAEGEAVAQQILARRRLWGVFLGKHLGLDPQESDDLACQLEHISSERLVAGLRAFLEQTPAPQPAAEQGEPPAALPLAGCAAGAQARIAAVSAEPVTAGFLRAQGLHPDAAVEVLAVGSDGAVLLGVAAQQLALAPSVARCVFVTVNG